MVVEFRTVVSINLMLNYGEYLNCFRVTIIEQSDLNQERKDKKNATFTITHFYIKLSSAKFLENYMRFADHKGTKRGGLGA